MSTRPADTARLVVPNKSPKRRRGTGRQQVDLLQRRKLKFKQIRDKHRRATPPESVYVKK